MDCAGLETQITMDQLTASADSYACFEYMEEENVYHQQSEISSNQLDINNNATIEHAGWNDQSR